MVCATLVSLPSHPNAILVLAGPPPTMLIWDMTPRDLTGVLYIRIRRYAIDENPHVVNFAT